MEISDIQKQRKEYRNKVLSELKKKKTMKVAYHYNCCDGIVSGAIVKKLFEKNQKLVYLPIDYSLLNNPNLREKFEKANWFAIVDLEPFNLNEMELYVDHHISAVGKLINARKIFFEAGGLSTSYLLSKNYSSVLPDYMIELAKMTEITDTASYSIPPPIELESSLDDFNEDTKIWFLEDACKTAFTLEDHAILTDILSKKGWIGLWDFNDPNVEFIHKKISNLRYGRKKAHDVSQEIEIADFVILIDRPSHYNITYIAHEVMYRGAKGTAYLTEYPDITRISLRLSKKLTDEQIDFLRVDKLAKTMNGGGHKPASGAQLESTDEAVKRISSWAKKMKLSVNIVDLRTKP
ncbi:MAG: hypothetical protein K9W46_07215 [Candidatus Heimdallarchaeum endolithica]|uniref:DHHA1 domain-containing protein n=1 Tax=Candidatus Heimdallarchaeum endolithica TaxID=2876572 RepID=A0A9Y1BNM5_9ARCH|nr:MAG: hypothetical protein K9W46_07215 [Candidatus Heimdallarchaeum endolithica]